jgi:YVTN family beta-propeller protein
MRRYPWFLAILAVLGGSFLTVAQAQQATLTYEVWAADQNANILYVLDPDGNVLRTVDGATLGDAKRPHMLVGVPKDAYVYSANTASNSVSVLSVKDGKVKAVIAGVGKGPHAAQPHPVHPERIYVANIAPQAMGSDGKPDRGETISEVVRTGNITWEVKRFLDLKAAPALADTNHFPSRRPVCAGFSKDGRHMLVTLFDGGLALVDLQAWNLVKGWGKDEIAKHGCGFAASPSGDELYVTAGDQHASWLYVFDVAGEPKLVASHNLSQVGQDAHGAAIDPLNKTLWVIHRVSSNATMHPLANIRQAGHQFQSIDFVGKTPDLIAFAPDHRRAYVTLRGPKPAPTIPHATVGETPGVAIIDVANRKLVQVIKLGDQAAADFHGIFIPFLEKDKS